LRGRYKEIAKRSMTVAASFGLAASLSVVVLGDESGYLSGEHQKMKLAAIEAMWDTEKAPASFTLFGLPDVKNRETHFAIHIPWVMGIIGTRSFDEQIPGIKDLVAQSEKEIRQGILAYDALEKIQQAKGAAVPQETIDQFENNGRSLGYALLLKRYVDDPRTATDEQISKAAWDLVPEVPVIFWAFRIMLLPVRTQ